MAETTEPMLVLVTGATGYIGGRLGAAPASGGLSRPLLGARPGAPAGPALAGSGRGRGRRCPASRDAARGHGRHRRGLLSDSQHGGRPGLPRTRPDRGAQLRRGRGGCRRRAHHLYGRPGRPRNGTLGASAFAPGYRRRAARGRRAGHRVSRRRHRRFGQPVVRADPLSDRALAGDDLPALALHLHPAHRHPQRVGVSDCRAGDAGKHRGDHRDRRRGRADLRRHDARLCQGARPDAPAHSGARADPAPLLLLGAPGHADPGRDRRAADRRAAQ